MGRRFRKPITPAEAREMQGMRDMGSSMVEIGLAFDCTGWTVSQHTKPSKDHPDLIARNVRLAQLVAGLSPDGREIIARRNGLAGRGSLKSTLSQFRRKQRQHTGAEA